VGPIGDVGWTDNDSREARRRPAPHPSVTLGYVRNYAVTAVIPNLGKSPRKWCCVVRTMATRKG